MRLKDLPFNIDEYGNLNIFIGGVVLKNHVDSLYYMKAYNDYSKGYPVHEELEWLLKPVNFTNYSSLKITLKKCK